MTKERASSQLSWCLFWIYTISILGKTSFSSVTAALIGEGILSKTQAGQISGVYWLLYAVGQFFGGFVANKMSAYMMMKIGIIASTIANLLMMSQNDSLPMFIIWGLGGVLQFGMWPAVLKLISDEVIPKQKSGTMMKQGFCYCLGSVLSYILTSVILTVLSWRHMFLVAGMIAGISLPITILAERKLSPLLQQVEIRKETEEKKRGKLTWNVVWKSELLFFCLLIIIKSIADNGIKNWMPTIFMETYGTAPNYASLLSVGLLITNFFGVMVCLKIFDKVENDELLTLRILYVIVVPMLLLLLNFENMNIYISTVLMSGVTIFIYGSGQFISTYYPGRLMHLGLTATVGGIINAFGSLGNVLATYGSGYIADCFGWNAMIKIWNALILLFVALTIVMIPMWKKFRWRSN